MQIYLNPHPQSWLNLSWSDLPSTVKQLLLAAADTWENTAQSQAYIEEALSISGRSLDVLVAAYRYFFYKHNDSAALQIATQVLEQVQQAEQFPDAWDDLALILSQRKEDSIIRLYLNAYAASGLIRARLGELDTATLIMSRVNTIDDKREFGAATILHVLTHFDTEEEG